MDTTSARYPAPLTPSARPGVPEWHHGEVSAVEIPMSRLVEWTGGAPVVRAETTAGEEQPALGLRRGPAWAVAFVRPTHTHGNNLMLHAGDDTDEVVSPAAAGLLEELVTAPPFAGWVDAARAKGATGVSLPRSLEHLGGLLAAEGGRWEWMSSTAVPAGDRDGLIDLPGSTRQELLDFLAEHNARTDGQPFARPGQRWVGARDDGGRLLGIGCCEEEISGAPVLAGITVAPCARGRGLGRAITAELTRGAIASHGWSTLGMYSDNDIARGIYLGLGYRIGARWTSGRLA